jgi:hypothetical protein
VYELRKWKSGQGPQATDERMDRYTDNLPGNMSGEWMKL